jgi:hypothetical protein
LVTARWRRNVEAKLARPGQGQTTEEGAAGSRRVIEELAGVSWLNLVEGFFSKLTRHDARLMPAKYVRPYIVPASENLHTGGSRSSSVDDLVGAQHRRSRFSARQPNWRARHCRAACRPRAGKLMQELFVSIGVSMKVGQSVLTRTPSGASSIAIARRCYRRHKRTGRARNRIRHSHRFFR